MTEEQLRDLARALGTSVQYALMYRRQFDTHVEHAADTVEELLKHYERHKDPECKYWIEARFSSDACVIRCWPDIEFNKRADRSYFKCGSV